MRSHTSSVLVFDVGRLAAQRVVRRESLYDFAGVAAGVGVGALVWLTLLSLVRASL